MPTVSLIRRYPRVRKTPLTRGLSHWWLFSGNQRRTGYVNDLVGFWHAKLANIGNGIRKNNGPCPTGRGYWDKTYDGGLLGGNSAYAEFATLTSSGGTTPIDDFTLAVWMRPTLNNAGFDRLVDGYYITGVWLGRWSASDVLHRGGVYTNGAGNVGVDFNTTNNVWQHLCFTRAVSTGGHIAYYNGIATGSTYTGVASAAVWYNPSRFFLNSSNSPGADSWSGGVNDIAVWDRVLSAEEVAAWYASSRNGHLGQIHWDGDPGATAEFVPAATSGGSRRRRLLCGGH